MDKPRFIFLDRDGVINIEKKEDYIHHWGEWIWYPGACEAVAALSNLADRLFIVTNQKGIGRGLTRQEDVELIHQNLEAAVVEAGGRIDAIYYCPDTDAASPCRKPNTGMALRAKAAFPDVDFEKSVMVGNNPSDLHFGRGAGMQTVLVTTTRTADSVDPSLADFVFPDLAAYADFLINR